MNLRQDFNYSNADTLALSQALSFSKNLKEPDFSENEKEQKPTEVLYLRVIADMNPERAIMPKKIIWSDGREFDIQKITDVRRGFIKTIGELCMKYYCLIDGNFRILCLNDDMKWFTLK